LSSPAGLRLEIGRKSDKKKMNLIFNYVKKIFLTGKCAARVGIKTERACRKDVAQRNRNDSAWSRRTDLISNRLAMLS
jgi:hypothetical protein